MLPEQILYIGAALSFIGAIAYVIPTLRGEVKPNRVSWFLWSLAPLIAFASQVTQGVGLQSLTTFAIGFSPLLVLAASFLNKKSVWKLGTLDYVCGALSLLGLFLWYLTKVGNIAISLSIVADALAYIPTMVKAYKAPETEDYKIYLFGSISGLLTLLTIKNWTFAAYGFPLYIFFINIPLVLLIRFKLGKRLSR